MLPVTATAALHRVGHRAWPLYDRTAARAAGVRVVDVGGSFEPSGVASDRREPETADVEIDDNGVPGDNVVQDAA